MYAEIILDERPFTVLEVKESWLTNQARGRLRNMAYYSLQSARVWARVIVPGVVEWETCMAEAPGEAPFHYGGIPGSLISMHSPEVPADFPPELLERELLIHLSARRYFK